MIAAGFQLDISRRIAWKKNFHTSENAFHFLRSRMQKT